MVNLEAYSLELVYVGDPMCSWCWGFAPVVENIDGAFDIPMRTAVGGLRPDDKAEPIDRIRPMLEHHWSQVAAASGETLRFLSTVQRAFYADRVDVTDIDVYPDLVADFPVNPSEFIEALESPEMHAAAEQDFIEAQRLGVTGFPTLLLRDGATTVPLSLGYTTFERVAERINDFIEKNHPEVAAGLVCDIDGEAC